MHGPLQHRSEKEKQKETTRSIAMNSPVSKAMNMKLPKLEIKRSCSKTKKYKSFKDSLETEANLRSDIEK